MSHLSEELERQMEAAKTNPLQVAGRSNISASQLYKWTNGEQTSLDKTQITSLARALSNKISDNAMLVKAHLEDERFGPGSELIRIEVDLPSALQDRPRPRSRREKALAFLSEISITSRDTTDMLVQFARIHGATDL